MPRSCQRVLGAALAVVLLGPAACEDAAPPAGDAGDALGEALGGDVDPGFARAIAPRIFVFPHDHGPHRQYRNEWWYVTGNVADAAGRRFGFQITMFRIGLAPGAPTRPSRWATREIWMAHLALTDASGGTFHARERFARGGDIGLAGATRDPVQVWLDDWRLERASGGRWRLRAATETFALDLALDSVKAPVLQGDHGLSRKSAETGNASYYYSLTRMATEGTLRLDDRRHTVSGSAWMDREWSTSALADDQAGWDWFALQLDDGTDVMFYRLRHADGATDRWSAGSLVRPDGEVIRLAARDVEIETLATWTNDAGDTYPARWRLDVADLDRTLTVEPVLADQEIDATVRYWEGAVDVEHEGRRVGRGYVELTGYSD